jgi:hypothetical protein
MVASLVHSGVRDFRLRNAFLAINKAIMDPSTQQFFFSSSDVIRDYLSS